MKRTRLTRKTPLRKYGKKSTIQKLHKKAWQTFSRYVRQKAKGVCYTCGIKKSWQEMDAGHFRHGRLDYDERNIHCQCTRCNRFMHGNLGVYAEKLVADYNGDILLQISRDANQVKKWTEDELKEIISKYEKLTNELPLLR